MREERNQVVRQATLLAVVALLLSVGCARKVPQEVTDVNAALSQAKDACAGVYAAGDLQTVQSGADSMNSWANQKKYKKARKEAVPLQPQVDSLKSTADSARVQAKQDAGDAIAAADAALGKARGIDAQNLVASQYGAASSKLQEAKQASNDPCKYPQAATLANQAATLAKAAEEAAVIEIARLEEEARRLAEEEERLRREAEARRLAEEEAERLRRFPPVYTVQEGDSLWRITGMEKIYGNPIYWPIVYEANDDRIADPDLIYPGQEFVIPRDVTVAEMDSRMGVLWARYSVESEE